MREPTEIVPGVYGLGSDLVNWYLVADEGRLTAVDAGLPGFRGRLEEDLQGLGREIADVQAVVLTHSDSDHTGLAPSFQAAGARVLIHLDDEGTLRQPRPNKGGDASPIHMLPHLWKPRAWRFMGSMARAGGGRPSKVEGAETFADGDVLDVPGQPRVVHMPGHTPGHCALLFERHGALFVGDALCTWNPLTNALGPQVMPSAFNVNTARCFESLAVMEPLEAQVVLAGHGDPWRDSPAAALARAREAGRS
jgi:glyoxylase-like metal-dependent hydrolase (beta-lactamase superfamily II)